MGRLTQRQRQAMFAKMQQQKIVVVTNRVHSGGSDPDVKNALSENVAAKRRQIENLRKRKDKVSKLRIKFLEADIKADEENLNHKKTQVR